VTNSTSWEILDGLPPYGPMAAPFSATGQGMHREGLVVRFSSSTGSWVGNFQRGGSSLDHVFAHPDGRHGVVVAGGTAYVVDAESRRLVDHFGANIEDVFLVAANGYVLLGNGLWFEALGPSGLVWRTRRISWDRMRNLSLDGTAVRGEASAPWGPDGAWYPFEVDAVTGSVSGGSYNGPPM
jgi:hypothetical protein